MPKLPDYYQRPDGLFESILRINGKRVAFRGKTRLDVYNKIKSYDRQAAKEEKTVLFETAADDWWEAIEPMLEHNTAKSYRPAVIRAKEYFGKNDIAGITAKQIDDYIKDFSATRSRKTVVTQLQIIRQIMRKAEVDGRIKYNPAASVKPPRNLPQARREAPKKEQIDIIKKSVGAAFGLFAYLIYYTGCRRGEALALTGADIDRKRKLIHITKSVYHVGNTPHIKQPKTEKGYRDVPLLADLDRVLPKRLPKGYLFTDADGTSLLTNDHFTSRYDTYRKETGVAVTPHQIRHGYATALFESGVDAKTAQTLLGHAQLSTTMDIYTHVCEDVINEAAKKMNKGF